jgi:competence protein ComEA
MKKFNTSIITIMAVTFFTMSGFSWAEQVKQSAGKKIVTVEQAKDATVTAMNTETVTEGQDVSKKINVNTATSEELAAIPGVGEETAKSIIAFRDANGPFKDLEELLNIKGIEQETFDSIKDRLTVQ